MTNNRTAQQFSTYLQFLGPFFSNILRIKASLQTATNNSREKEYILTRENLWRIGLLRHAATSGILSEYMIKFDTPVLAFEG